MEFPAKLQDVVKTENQQDEAMRVHLASQGSQELYFEVTRYVSLPPQDEYQRHRVNLERQLDDFAITELNETNLASHLAHTYSFTWQQGERTVILVEHRQATYMVGVAL